MTGVLLLVMWLCAPILVCAADQPTLGFYVVSQEAHPGLHYVDFAAFPKLDYIAEKPDLAVSEIEAVTLGTDHDRSSIVHKDGSVEQFDEDRAAFVIRLTAKDAKAFKALTSAHIGARILFMLGNQPLFAPVVRSPIDTQELQISLFNGANPNKLKSALDALVPKSQ